MGQAAVYKQVDKRIGRRGEEDGSFSSSLVMQKFFFFLKKKEAEKDVFRRISIRYKKLGLVKKKKKKRRES